MGWFVELGACGADWGMEEVGFGACGAECEFAFVGLGAELLDVSD